MKMTLKNLWNLRMIPTTKANDLKSLLKMKKTLGSAVQLSSLFLFICSIMPDQNRRYLCLAKAKKEHGLLHLGPDNYRNATFCHYQKGRNRSGGRRAEAEAETP